MKLIAVGSGNDVHIKLNSPFVSGYHAEILLLDNGEILLTDKGSKNGTYLNERRLQPNKEVPVRRGDNVRFADVPLNWHSVPAVPLPDMSKVKEMRGIGTNFRNKYQLQGDRVSRFHATLKKMNDGKWYIQDHSKNGTTVNGQPIPSNQDVRLKRGDAIACAGVPVPNPYGKGINTDTKKIVTGVSVCLMLCAAIFGVVLLAGKIQGHRNNEDRKWSKTMSDEEIYSRYKNSVVLLVGSYYYKVSAGNLDLERLCGLPTEVVMMNGEIYAVDGNEDRMNIYTGTGFFISEDGKIVTNLHIARPWLFEKEQSIISDNYKMFIAGLASELPELNAYTAQVKVEGVISYIGMIPNGAYFSMDNIKKCRELVAHDNTEKDVAILQLETKRLPDGQTTIVNMADAVVDDSDIRVGSHIYTLGFPFGLSLQDLKSEKGVQLLANGGSITQESTEFTFGFNAPSYGGASGSPVFNDKGQLIGVLNSGVSKSQGFNYAVKASHLKDLLKNIPVE